MFRLSIYFIFALSTIFTACIGVDVVLDEDLSSAQLIINNGLDSLKVGDTFQLTATLIDDQGNNLATNDIIWTSLYPENVQTNQNGLITAIAVGEATIIAQYNVLSDSISFTVGQSTVSTNSREISFSGKNGYSVNGSGMLSSPEDDLILTFDQNFSAQSGPGLVVYLSNSSSSVQGGVEIAPLKANNGSQSYNISQILIDRGDSTSVNLNTYDFVIIYCKPFGITFGTGTIQP